MKIFTLTTLKKAAITGVLATTLVVSAYAQTQTRVSLRTQKPVDVIPFSENTFISKLIYNFQCGFRFFTFGGACEYTVLPVGVTDNTPNPQYTNTSIPPDTTAPKRPNSSAVVVAATSSTNQPQTILYQVIERAVPGPQGPKGDKGDTGAAGATAIVQSPTTASAPANSPTYYSNYSTGSQYNGSTNPNTSFNSVNTGSLTTGSLNTPNTLSASGNTLTSNVGGSVGTSSIITSNSITASSGVVTVNINGVVSTTSIASLYSFLASSTNNNLTVTTDSAGNIVYVLSDTPTFNSVTATSGNILNLIAQNSILQNATATNLSATNLQAANATTTNLFSSILSSLSGFISNLLFTNATGTNLAATNLTATNATFTNISVPNTLSSSGNVITLNIGGSVSTTSAVNSNILAANSGIITSTINGVVATTSVSHLLNFFAVSPNNNLTVATDTAGNVTYSFTNDAILNSLTATNSAIQNLSATISTLTNASSTNLFSNLLSALSAYISNLFFGNATGGNITATGTATLANIVGTNATITDVAVTGNFALPNIAIGTPNSPLLIEGPNGVIQKISASSLLASNTTNVLTVSTSTNSFVWTSIVNGVVATTSAGIINNNTLTYTADAANSLVSNVNGVVSTTTIGTLNNLNLTGTTTSQNIVNSGNFLTNFFSSALASITNSLFGNATGTNITATGTASLANIVATNTTSTNLSAINATTTNIVGTNATFTNISVPNSLSASGNTLTANIGGSVATSSIITSSSLSSSGTILTSTINGVATSTDLQSIINAGTTNVLTVSTSTNSFTLTSNVNGVVSTTSAQFINQNALTSAVNTLTSAVNGVTSTSSIVNSNALAANAGVITSTINGVVATTSISNLYKFIASSTNNNLTVATDTLGNVTYIFTDNPIFGNATTTNLNTTGLTATNATLTSATSSNFFSNILSVITGYISNLLFNNATGTNITATGTATLANIVGTTASITSATITNLFSTNASITNATFTNVSVPISQTAVGNTLTTNVAGSIATSSIITNNTLSVSTSTNSFTLTSNTNGVISTTTAKFINSNTLTASSGVITSTVNGVVATTSVSNLLKFFASSTNANLTVATDTLGNVTYSFTSNPIFNNATTTNLATTNLTGTNATLTNATSTSLFSNLLSAITASISNLLFGNATGINLAVTGNTNLGSIASGTATNSLLVNDGSGNVRQISASQLLASNTTNTFSVATTTNNFTWTSNVNGIVSTSSANIINSNTISTTTNSFTSLVNGVASAVINFINSFTQSAAGNTLTTTINGVTATSSIITANGLSASGTVLTSTVNGVATSTDLQSVINSGTTNILTVSTSTNSFLLTSTVNGKVATTTANFVNANTLTSAVNQLTSVVNGVTSTSSIINSNTLAANAGVITTTINGVVATTSISSLYKFIASSTNNNLTVATDTLGNVTYIFTNNPIFGNATITNAFISNATTTNLATTNLTGTNATLTNATTTNLFSNLLSAITASITNLLFGNATGTSLTSSRITATSSATLATTTLTSVNTGAATNSLLTINASGTVEKVSATTLLASNTTNTLSNASTTNSITLTNTTNGVVATTSFNLINSNVISTTTNSFTSLVNGVASAVINFINSFTQSAAGNTLTTTINGVTATSSIITGNTVSYATTTQVLTSNVNGVVSTTSIPFSTMDKYTTGATGTQAVVSGLATTTVTFGGVNGQPTYAFNVRDLDNQTLTWNGMTGQLAISGAGGSGTTTVVTMATSSPFMITDGVNTQVIDNNDTISFVVGSSGALTSVISATDKVTYDLKACANNEVLVYNGVTSTWDCKVSSLQYYAEDTTAPNAAPTVATGNHAVAIGDGASALGGRSMVFGANSSADKESVVLGNDNVSLNSYNTITGNNNKLDAEWTYLSGYGNQVSGGSQNFIAAISNTIAGAYRNFIAGVQNTFNGSVNEDNQVIGNSNTVSGDLYLSQILGNNNSITQTTKFNSIIGNNNVMPSGDESAMVGHYNTIDASRAFILGYNLTNNISGTVDIGVDNATKFTIDSAGRAWLRGPLNVSNGDGTSGEILVSQGGLVPPKWSSVASMLTAGNGIAITGTSTVSVNSPTCVNSERLVWDGTQFKCPATTNGLSVATTTNNAVITSTVNGIAASTTFNFVNSNGLSISGATLTSTVNGIATSTNLTNLVASATTNTLSSSANTLTSTVNGKIATSTIINTNTLATTTNTIQTIVNGISSAITNIINQLTASVTGNVLTVNVNGVTATSSVVTSNTLSSAGNVLTNSTNGVSATSTIINSNQLSISGATLTSTVNGIATSTNLSGLVASATTNTLSNSSSTNSILLTNTTNGVVATTSFNLINSNVISTTTNSFTSLVNGVASAVINFINSFTQSAAGNTLTTTINGVTATSSIVTSNTLTSAGNVLTNSTNGVNATSTIINSNQLSISGATLTSTVNGVATSTGLAGLVASATTNVLSYTAGASNTLQSTINGVLSTTSINTLNNITLTGTTTAATITAQQLNTTGLTTTNATVTNATTTNLFSNLLSAITASITNLLFGNATGTSLTLGTLTATSSATLATTTLTSVNTGAATNSLLTINASGTVEKVSATTLLASNTTNTLSNASTTNSITLTNTTNGVVATTSFNFVNSNTLATTTNTLQTIVNGISSAITNIINQLTVSVAGNVLTVNVNGVTATTSVITSNVITGTGNGINSTVNGVVASFQPATGTITNTLGFDAVGNLIKQTPGSFLASNTSNVLAFATSTGLLSSTVNGVLSTTSLLDMVCNNLQTGTFSFCNGGNTSGALATLGTNDAFDLAFETNNIEKMRLFSLANPSLGLGVTSLAAVNGGASSYSGPTLFLGSAGNISGPTGLDIILDNDNNSSSGSDFRIRTNGDGAASTTDLMTVLETGNVGIGTSTPGYKLTVNASANPLQLTGLQTGTATDSILTVDPTGVVRQYNGASYIASNTTNVLSYATSTGVLTSTVNGVIATTSVISNLGSVSVLNKRVYQGIAELPTSMTGSTGGTIMSVSYTPVSNNSYIIMEYAYDYSMSGYGPDSWRSDILVNGTSIASRNQVWTAAGAGGGTRSGALSPISARYTNTSYAPITVALSINRNSSDDAISVSDANRILIITETPMTNGSATSTIYGGTPISSLLAAISTNSIDNTSYAQAWNWSTLSTSTALALSANAITSGTLLDLTTSSTNLNSTNGFFRVANNSTPLVATGIFARLQPNVTAGSGMTLLNNGNVGIGTTTPGNALVIASSTGGVSGLRLGISSTTATTTYIGKVLSVNANGDVVLVDDGVANPNVNCTNSTSIYCQGGNAFGATGVLGTKDANAQTFITNNTEKMRIDTAGNVGIGTSTPISRLTVVDPTATGGYNKILSVYSTGLTTGGNSQIAWGVGNSYMNQAEFNFRYMGSGSTSNLVGLGLNGAPTILNIVGTGNVGIGTTTPGNALTISSSTSNVSGLRLGINSNTVTSATSSTFLTVNANGDVVLASSSIASSSLTGFINGQALFGNTAGGISQSPNFFWDNTKNILSIGSSTVQAGALTAIGGTSFSSLPYGVASVGFISHTTGWNGSGFVFSNSNVGSNMFSMVYNVDEAWFGSLTATTSTVMGKWNTSRLFVAGNLGVGTQNPGNKVEITSATGGTSGLRFTNLTSASATTSATAKVLSVNATGDVVLVDAAQAASSTCLAGSTYFCQNGNTFAANAVLGTNDAFAQIFETNNLERMRIDATGNVGIGITTPVQLLQVHQASTTASNLIQITNGTTGSSNTDGLQVGVTSGGQAMIRNQENTPFIFGTNAVEVARFSANGFFGLGTTTPANRLSVAGAASIGTNYSGLVAPNNGLIVEGSVGIGTPTPGNALHVASSSGSISGIRLGINAATVATTSNGKVLTVNSNGDVVLANDSSMTGLDLAAQKTTALTLTTASQTVIYDTEVADINNAHVNTTGIYTAPVTDMYEINASAQFTYPAAAAGTACLVIDRAGTQITEGCTGDSNDTGGAAFNANANVSAVIALTAGQTVKINAYRKSGTVATLINTANTNYFTIKRVGYAPVVSSDINLKKDIQAYTLGLQDILGIKTKSYQYNGTSKWAINDGTIHVGLIAQDIQNTNIGKFAIATGTDGFLKFDKDPVIFATVNSIQEITKGLTEIDAATTTISTTTVDGVEQVVAVDTFAGKFWKNVKAQLVAWFADVANGIGDFFAKKVYTDQICVKRADGTYNCVTGDSLNGTIVNYAPSTNNATPTTSDTYTSTTTLTSDPAADWTDPTVATTTATDIATTTVDTSTSTSTTDSTTTVSADSITTSTATDVTAPTP